MNVKKVLLLTIVMVLFILPSAVQADDLKGYMIPEYYTVLGHNEGEEGEIQGQHGFWLRRIYFGYNTKLSDKLSARVRLEMASTAFAEAKLVPFVKNAHLKYKLGGGANLIFGIIDPPSFNKIEKFWGYRFLEKTGPDFFKLASSRDFGLSLDGKSKGGLVYTLMYGNYSSNKSEDNKGKAFYGRVGYQTKSLYAEVNGHYAADGSKKYTFLSGFVGCKANFGRAGLGYHYKNQDPETGDSNDTSMISGFGIIKMSKKSEVVLRYDHYLNENLKNISGYFPVVSADAPARFLIAGINFKVHKMVNIMPNIKYAFYSNPDSGSKPEADFHFLITGYVKFKTSL